MKTNKRSLNESSSDDDFQLSDDEKKTSTSTGGGKKKKKPRPQYDEARKQEIRETNKLAARECRARKKRLMSELEKTVGSLTAEHSALVKQNRELSIRLETLQRTVGPPPSAAAAGGGGAITTTMSPQLATVANSATSLLSGLSGGVGGQPPAMGSNLMMPNAAAQMALLAQLNANANTNPAFPNQQQQMLSQMLANNSLNMMNVANLASANNNANLANNNNNPTTGSTSSNCNTPNPSTGSAVGTPKQIQFFPVAGGSTTPSIAGTGTPGVGGVTPLTGGAGGAGGGGAPATSASDGNPPLKQTDGGAGQLPISVNTMNTSGLTI